MPRVTSYRPTDGQPVGTVEETSASEVAAMATRADAVASMVADVPPWVRRAWLEAIADRLEADRVRLARIAEDETGLGMVRLDGEVGRAASQLRFYGSVAQEGSYFGLRLDSATVTTPRLVRVSRARGAVAVFGASNFPFAFGALGNDTASALAAGCPVVVVAHPAHVVLHGAVMDIARDALVSAGGPADALTSVVGIEAGRHLVAHPAITAVGFTGSPTAGLALWRIACERTKVIPVFAEMSTVNPVVMTTGSTGRLADIAAGFVGSFTLGAGQFCTKPGLLLAPAGQGVADAVGDALLRARPTSVMLTEPIAEAARRGVEAWRGSGASVVARVPSHGDGWRADAVVVSAPANAIVPGSPLTSECFGPVAVVVEYADLAELHSVLATLDGSLAGTVMTDGSGMDPECAQLVAAIAPQVGRVTVDDWPTGVAWSWAQHHGGPWPATTAPEATSVGASAVDRWVVPVTYQSVPDSCLPPVAQSANPWRIPRRIDGRMDLPTPPGPSGS